LTGGLDRSVGRPRIAGCSTASSSCSRRRNRGGRAGDARDLARLGGRSPPPPRLIPPNLSSSSSYINIYIYIVCHRGQEMFGPLHSGGLDLGLLRSLTERKKAQNLFILLSSSSLSGPTLSPPVRVAVGGGSACAGTRAAAVGKPQPQPQLRPRPRPPSCASPPPL
jgi:hypothetical protein